MDIFNETNKRTEEAFRDILDRLKKMTNALYRVTDLLSDREPVKWILRNKALSLYDNLMSLMSFTVIKDKNALLNEIMDAFCQILDLLDLCSNDSFISNLNFEILKKEYLALKSFIEGNRGELSSGYPLLLESQFVSAKHEPSGETKRISAGSEKKPNLADKKEEKEKSAEPKKADILETRQEKTIRILKQGPKTISEISVAFQGKIGLKTIQRDLVELVKQKKIIAKGERRWRVYSLANAAE